MKGVKSEELRLEHVLASTTLHNDLVTTKGTDDCQELENVDAARSAHQSWNCDTSYGLMEYSQAQMS